MDLRRFLIPFLLLVGGLFALLALQWKLDLGAFAASPQMVEVPLDASSVVAGGRAALEFQELAGDRATLRLWCAAGEVKLTLTPDRMEEGCGVAVRLVGFLNPRDVHSRLRAVVEVTWDDRDAAQSDLEGET